MSDIFLYNTLSREEEKFISIKNGEVGLYTCGPTVYNFAHLGNLRSYIFGNILKNVLLYNGYKVKHIINITDVGHLTGDGDMGEDKMEKGAMREGKSAWEIAEFFTKAFKDDLKKLNISEPTIWCKATDYIKEQIELVQILEKKGYTYLTSDGVYYDTSKFPDYNKLSHLKLEDLIEGARVEINEEKKNPTDFALWKFSPQNQKRQMEWDSPWGIGFPGWHIECSAMSLKLLGDQLDIHCGGIDHINVHHTNEIAQSEAATGHKFFNYWMHNAFMNVVGGKKMAKSEGNFLTLENALLKKNINPLAYRLVCLQVSYRKPMEYSDDIVISASQALNNLYRRVFELGKEVGQVNKEYKEKFILALNDDLNTPQAIAILQEVLKADLSASDKLATIIDFDKVLALDLQIGSQNSIVNEVPERIEELLQSREEARQNRDWNEADRLRKEIEEAGYIIEDSKDGVRVSKNNNL
ncbi:MAG: cysteine--tRNA ligase [Planctomycetes bacterium]|jgi:cysteinyl-tRNA synthetase|nr:cysteine--tRNA ligase [Planctomycetota bacterium]